MDTYASSYVHPDANHQWMMNGNPQQFGGPPGTHGGHQTPQNPHGSAGPLVASGHTGPSAPRFQQPPSGMNFSYQGPAPVINVHHHHYAPSHFSNGTASSGSFGSYGPQSAQGPLQQQQFWAPPQQQFGGPPQQQFGGPPQQQFGGPPQQQFGSQQQQFGGPPQQQQFGGQQQQQFGPPQPQQQFGSLPQQQFGPPQPQQQFGGPPQHQQFGGQQQQFGGPPQPQFGGPPQHQQFGGQQQQQQQQQQQFGGPPQQQFGGPPQQQFGGPPQQRFGGPSQQQFGGPPRQRFGGRLHSPPSQYGSPTPTIVTLYTDSDTAGPSNTPIPQTISSSEGGNAVHDLDDDLADVSARLDNINIVDTTDLRMACGCMNIGQSGESLSPECAKHGLGTPITEKEIELFNDRTVDNTVLQTLVARRRALEALRGKKILHVLFYHIDAGPHELLIAYKEEIDEVAFKRMNSECH